MFRLSFLICVILLLGLQSLFDTTTHLVSDDRHIFAYGLVGWVFFALFLLLPIPFAVIAWRWMRDRLAAGIMFLSPLLIAAAVMPQMMCERVEISKDQLSHRREPPHTRYNVDIAWQDMRSVKETKAECGTFATYYSVSYRFVTKRGEEFELPSNTVLTAAHETIDEALRKNGVPIERTIVRRP